MAIHPTLISFDLSPRALLQLATKPQADLKKNTINFYKCISLLSVSCFQLCHRNYNRWASSASIFFVLFPGDSSDVCYLPPLCEFMGLGCRGWAPIWASSSHRAATGSLQQGKQLAEHRRERNVSSNGELCLWSVENMQSSDLPFEAASQRVLFNDVAIPGGPAACPLAIDSFPGRS